MKAILISLLGFFLIVQSYSSPAHPVSNTTDNKFIQSTVDFTKNDTTKNQIARGIVPNLTNDLHQPIINNQNATADLSKRKKVTKIDLMENEDVIVIDLEKVNKMSPVEFIGRQLRSLWQYLLFGNKKEKETTFIGRCHKLVKKIEQLIPLITIGGGIVITKLGFLVLFSLKTIGMLGLLLLLNVGTIAAKLGATLASKKSEQSAQNLHFHVQKSDEHSYSSSSSHLHGPPYGWDDRIDKKLEGHELYNLYEKLKLENDIKKLISSYGGDNYHRM